MRSNKVAWFLYELVHSECRVIDGQTVSELELYKLCFLKENPPIKVEGNKLVIAKFTVDAEPRTFTTKVINKRK